MSLSQSKIIIIYDKLINPGGAERLALKYCSYLKKRGYKVEFWTTKINNQALFGFNKKDINIFKNWLSIGFSIFRHRKNIFIVDSGFIKFFLVSFFISPIYFVHLHHPLFMSFNDFDKFSFIHSKWKEKYLKSNLGAQNLIQQKFNILKKIKLNVRAIFFYLFVKKASGTIVLSNYAKKEKQDLFNIDSKVLRGALSKVVPFEIKKNSKNISFLMVGRLDKNKRIDLLIHVFKEFIYKNKQRISLDIIGTGEEYYNLIGLSKKLKLDDKIKFHGFVDDEDLIDKYKTSDVFISLDWADYKITMYEALNYSCQVIVTEETELEYEISQSGRVHLTTLDPKSIMIAMENSIRNVSKNYDNNILKPVLWNNYFLQTNNYIIKKLDERRVKSFNSIWKKSFKNIDFYREYKKKFDLPESISDFRELDKWPLISKDDIKKIKLNFPYNLYPKATTGGSTGQPLSIPVSWNQRFRERRITKKFRRRIFNNKKYKTIIIWGHSHLFGTGYISKLRKVKRVFFDFIYGYKRISTYESDQKILKKLNNFINLNSQSNILVIGYSKIIYEILKDFKNLRTKKNIKFLLTAENLEKSKKKYIEKKFGDMIVYEYGLAEFNAVAYKSKLSSNRYKVFLKNIIAQKSNEKLILTSIYNRPLPLIRYNTEDVIKYDMEEKKQYDEIGNFLTFSDILGRSNDFVQIKNGKSIKKVHSEYFTHALKSINGLNSYYIEQQKNLDINIFLHKTGNLDEQLIIKKLNQFIQIGNKITIIKVNSSEKYLTGKSKFIKVNE